MWCYGGVRGICGVMGEGGICGVMGGGLLWNHRPSCKDDILELRGCNDEERLSRLPALGSGRPLAL